MTSEKKILLEKTYQRFINEGLNPLNMDSLDEIVDPCIMGFGTTIDEKVFSLKDLREMLQRQKEQSEGFQIEFNIQPVYRFVAEYENIAAFADDLFLKVVMPDTTVDMYLRFTTVYEYKHEKWLAVHFHGSKPENVLSTEDTWGLETWKQKAKELETIVAERTATLLEKNSELEIEASLERVRTTAMAMQVPEDLLKICEVLFKELQAVGLKNLRNALIHTFNDEEKYFTDYDYSEFTGGCISRIPYSGHPAIDKFIKEVRSSRDAFTEITITGKELDDWRAFRTANNEARDDRLKEANTLYYYFYSVGPADIGISTFASISVYDRELLKRYRNVFDLAYKRYIDITKAEAQAREAQIEVALERVRSRTMAMHKSEELSETATVLFQQFKQLGENPGQVSIGIVNEPEQVIDMWVSMMENPKNPAVKVPIHEPIVVQKIYDAWKEQKKSLIIDLSGNELKEYIQFRRSLGTLQIDNELVHGRRVTNVAFFSKGIIALSAPEPRPAETIKLLDRFANVFDQAYTRFLDLQKAEAQAREAQIEAALERVRSRTMAMHNSEEVMDVAGTLFEEFQKLGFTFGASSIIIMNKETGDAEYWIAGFSKNKFPESYSVKYFQHPYHDQLLSAWKKGEKFLLYQLEGEEKQAYDEVLFSETGYRNIPNEEKVLMRGIPSVTFSVAFMKHGAIHWGPSHLTEEQANVLQRFAQVFDQTYTRFLDLQKAEAQAKEAHIELSLERIRAKVTAMQRSSDLLDIVVTMRREFVALGHEAHYFWHMRWLPDKYEKAMTSSDGSKIGMVMQLPRHIHGDIKLLADWEASDELTVVMAMDGETAAGYVHKMISLGDFEQVDPNAPTLDDIRNIGGLTFIMSRTTHGEIGYSLPGVVANPPAEDIATLIRFAAVFDLAYRRFEDLQSSEKRIREAQIELAIERVRAQTLAMYKSEELANLSLELVKQVQTLGVNTWFCAFNIYDDDSQSSLEWGSNGQGTFPSYRTPRDGIFLRYYQEGQKNQPLFINKIGEDECPAHYEYLCTLPGVGEQLLKMKADGIPFPTSQIDHVAFFKYGYIIFITYEPVPESHDIFKRFAKVFEQTYTRFLDLQMAEAQALRAEKDLVEIKAARKKAEKALTELRATQKQLIQSEKMASLGELTAGIAHEIQNPLNFVNNFSEVSKELLDEMKDALENGDSAEAKELAANIIQNLEKITHHGRRADAIVKGMLQHSRASSDQKELTDINALADEYFRLAYHGLRAKDKSFNATLKTDFDASITAVNIVPQDIGRAILNLITNAFHAVTEKKKTSNENFEPTVSVSTKKVLDHVELRVADNGKGISKEIIDKIFQPFFTTKPTGQGTGLGLSMSYDIITKGHSGTLRVKSSAGKGSEFIIQLPIENTHENISSR